MSFWEEIQKQYQNAEGRYRENLNTGINLMTNKANMMQQMFSNQMQSLGTQANMLSQSMQIPAQFTQMLANLDESRAGRRMQEDQFGKEYNLNERQLEATQKYNQGNLGINQQELGLKKQALDIELEERAEDKKNYIKAINTAYNPQNVAILRLRPDLRAKYNNFKKSGLNEQEIFDSLSSLSALTDKPVFKPKPVPRQTSTNARKQAQLMYGGRQ